MTEPPLAAPDIPDKPERPLRLLPGAFLILGWLALILGDEPAYVLGMLVAALLAALLVRHRAFELTICRYIIESIDERNRKIASLVAPPQCAICEDVGFTFAAAAMTPEGETPPSCPAGCAAGIAYADELARRRRARGGRS